MLDRLRAGDVDHGDRGRENDVGRDDGTFAHQDSFDDHGARADEGAVFDDDRPRLWRLEDTADAYPAREMDVAPICAHEPTVAHVSTIVRAPTHAPMFTNPGMRTTPSDRNAP